MKDILLVIFIILAIIYLVYLDFYSFIKNKILNRKAKRVSLIKMKVINKYHIRGKLGHIGGDRVLSKYPDSYILELRYDDLFHNINDEKLFNKLNIGDYLELYLIEILDDLGNVLRYEFKVSNG